MSFRLTEERILSEMAAVAKEHPDKIYRAPAEMLPWAGAATCFYVHESPDGQEAGCYIGTVLHRLGVPLEVLKEQETYSAGEVLNSLRIPGLTYETYTLIRTVQALQDEGENWGEAYRIAAGKLAG
ncbi:hypothetical protein [Streptomyces sp. NPDC005955]|uniref:hypothetical protein n=1 Tax=Streptomyces sp. NPDC005955 TaxID=3364738 RepID=UPI00369AFA67